MQVRAFFFVWVTPLALSRIMIMPRKSTPLPAEVLQQLHLCEIEHVRHVYDSIAQTWNATRVERESASLPSPALLQDGPAPGSESESPGDR